MSLTAVICTMALATTPATTLKNDWNEIASSVPFTTYRLGVDAIGYELIKAETVKVEVDENLPGLPAREALHLTYMNKASKNIFDIIQSPGGAKVNTRWHIKRLMSVTPFGLQMDETTTLITKRIGNTDVGFMATLISEPSAKYLVDRLVKIEKN